MEKPAKSVQEPRIFWPQSILTLLRELPEDQRALILQKVDRLRRFPLMYPARRKGRFRGHRYFVAGNWLVYYRVVKEEIYIRGIWPSRIP